MTEINVDLDKIIQQANDPIYTATTRDYEATKAIMTAAIRADREGRGDLLRRIEGVLRGYHQDGVLNVPDEILLEEIQALLDEME